MTNPKYLIPLLCVLFAGCTNTSNKENLAYQFIKPIQADKSLFNGDLKGLNATTLPALFSFTGFQLEGQHPHPYCIFHRHLQGIRNRQSAKR